MRQPFIPQRLIISKPTAADHCSPLLSLRNSSSTDSSQLAVTIVKCHFLDNVSPSSSHPFDSRRMGDEGSPSPMASTAPHGPVQPASSVRGLCTNRNFSNPTWSCIVVRRRRLSGSTGHLNLRPSTFQTRQRRLVRRLSPRQAILPDRRCGASSQVSGMDPARVGRRRQGRRSHICGITARLLIAPPDHDTPSALGGPRRVLGEGVSTSFEREQDSRGQCSGAKAGRQVERTVVDGKVGQTKVYR